mmetsp:Transcript_2515/g.6934  ORF Transcript_2515/g.6934 Transcript_2515/m.6934 type:complete len:208 (-) Transcript_2515:2628-3251(-)
MDAFMLVRASAISFADLSSNAILASESEASARDLSSSITQAFSSALARVSSSLICISWRACSSLIRASSLACSSLDSARIASASEAFDPKAFSRASLDCCSRLILRLERASSFSLVSCSVTSARAATICSAANASRDAFWFLSISDNSAEDASVMARFCSSRACWRSFSKRAPNSVSCDARALIMSSANWFSWTFNLASNSNDAFAC